jgi:chemotaxis protein MotA
LLPFAANLAERTSQELLLQRMIVEGALAIQSEMNPRLLEIKLKSVPHPVQPGRSDGLSGPDPAEI